MKNSLFAPILGLSLEDRTSLVTHQENVATPSFETVDPALSSVEDLRALASIRKSTKDIISLYKHTVEQGTDHDTHDQLAALGISTAELSKHEIASNRLNSPIVGKVFTALRKQALENIQSDILSRVYSSTSENLTHGGTNLENFIDYMDSVHQLSLRKWTHTDVTDTTNAMEGISEWFEKVSTSSAGRYARIRNLIQHNYGGPENVAGVAAQEVIQIISSPLRNVYLRTQYKRANTALEQVTELTKAIHLIPGNNEFVTALESLDAAYTVMHKETATMIEFIDAWYTVSDEVSDMLK